MGIAATEGKLDNRLEISPTDYAIETFIPVFKEGPRAIPGGQNEQGAPLAVVDMEHLFQLLENK